MKINRSYYSELKKLGPARISVVNNYTNITNVTVHNHSSHGGSYGGYHGRKHVHHRHDRHERPPKLTRFLASGGLLDYDKAARMSDGELMDESAKVLAYGAKGFAHSVGGIASDLGRVGKSLCGIAVAIGDAIFGE